MQKWMIKAAVQKIFSILPYSHYWNGLAQRYTTGTLKLDPEGEFRTKLTACQKLSEYYRTAAQREIEGAKVVELGTGWFPILPIGLYLQGASEIWSWDVVSHLRPDTFKQTLDAFVQFDETASLQQILPGVKPGRLCVLRQFHEQADRRTPQALLERLNIHALIGDVRRSELAPESVDFVFSHAVLQHLHRDDAEAIFVEFRRLLKNDGVMCHYVGCRDQYACHDSSITPFNYLKYTARQWKVFNNSIIPQNRLRISDYRDLLEQTSFCLQREDNLLGSLEDLRSVRLAPEFTNYSFDDLLVCNSWMVATPAPAKTPEWPIAPKSNVNKLQPDRP